MLYIKGDAAAYCHKLIENLTRKSFDERKKALTTPPINYDGFML